MPKRKSSIRQVPNIVITGTPGTGKSRLSKLIAEKTGLKWIDVSKKSVEQNWIEGRDNELDCGILDEDAMLDALEEEVPSGGVILDYHACELFPERWIDQVYVLRTENDQLYDRLKARDYNNTKIQNNLTSEIFQTILEEATNSYSNDIVHELMSNNEDDIGNNLNYIVSWIEQFKREYRFKKKGAVPK